jgi:hypothetical protein
MHSGHSLSELSLPSAACDGHLFERATRFIDVNGARLRVCADCYENRHLQQPMIVQQRTLLWDSANFQNRY